MMVFVYKQVFREQLQLCLSFFREISFLLKNIELILFFLAIPILFIIIVFTFVYLFLDLQITYLLLVLVFAYYLLFLFREQLLLCDYYFYLCLSNFFREISFFN